jgi:cation transport ATPase
MAIRITCSSCHTRFQVGEQFAGQTGPCPKCKHPIEIPAKGEEVKIHAPTEFEGVRDSQGNVVLKPATREKVELNRMGLIVVIAASLMVLILAVVVRYATEAQGSMGMSILGAILLAPPLVYGGYTFLRDSELEAYTGTSLWIRVGICSAVYAGLWLVYSLVVAFGLHTGGEPPQVYALLFVVPPIVAAGATAGFACFDVEFGSGFFHYALYLLVTAGLRLITGPPLWTF